MRKIISMVLCLVLVLSLSVTAFAATITINDQPITGASYVAYQLLTAENVPELDANGEPTGNGTNKYIYVVNSDYRSALISALELSSTATDDEIINAIYALKHDATGLQKFADDVYAAIDPKSYDEVATNNQFTDIDQGYYLIAESEVGKHPNGDKYDTYSLVMLDTAGLDAVEVTTKENLPTVVKKVQEVNDSTGAESWAEFADYDIGDTVDFEITGTISDKYANYKSYDYMFSDTMEPGLTLNNGSVVVKVVNGNSAVDVTSQFTITYNITDDTTTPTADSFTAVANLKKLTDVTINANTTVVVTYNATLNENATRGADWNENEVVLKFENNPYYVAVPDADPHVPGETPPSIAVVFTFQGNIDKVDQDGDPLAGATFTLHKWYGTNDEGEWKAVGTSVVSGKDGKLAWPGLDAGKYKLVEDDAPTGYNKADDLIFQVVARYDADNKLAELSILDSNGQTISSGESAQFTIDVPKGEFTTEVTNRTGTELPSTGGIGTTILYVIGTVLVLGAVVMLVTKKRMASAE